MINFMFKDILFRSHSSINKKNCLSRLKIMFVVRYLYCQICQCILTFADIIVFTSFGREQRLLFEEGWEQKIKEEDTNAIWKKSRIISYFTDLYQNTENTVFFIKITKNALPIWPEQVLEWAGWTKKTSGKFKIKRYHGHTHWTFTG